MRSLRWLPGVLLLLGGLSGCATAGGARGGGTLEGVDRAAEAARHAPLHPLSMEPEEFLRVARGIYVVVDLDVNRLHLMHGRDTLWTAAVGTGTGLRLEGEEGDWHFATPQGVFLAQYKEEIPVWIAPDWFFVEKGLPIPPPGDKRRYFPGDLGAAAVFIGQDLAIHGTERPELLGQRVSHGCIRLANKYAQRLFHDVQIGTPVVIIGGEDLGDQPAAKTTDSGKPGVELRDTLGGYSTTELLARLDDALAHPDTVADWVPLTSRLITRGLKDDSLALRGILARAGTAATAKVRLEYDAFLADAFARGGLRAVVSLARIGKEERERAAAGIVRATLALHPGGAADPSAPWPTHRLPKGRLGPDGREGWAALQAAEEAYREDHALADAGDPAPAGARR